MATDRSEKLGDGFVEWGEGRRLSMPAFVGLTRAVLDKGRSMRFRAKGKSMTPFIKDGDIITIAPVLSPNSKPVVQEAAASSGARPKPRTIP